MSAMLLYIIANAVMFSFLMTPEQIPQAMAQWMLDKGLGMVAFLLLVNVSSIFVVRRAPARFAFSRRPCQAFSTPAPGKSPAQS